MALFFYKEKNKDIRAAAYLRLSIEDGDKAESNSIGNQRELIRDFAAERPGLHLIEEYADDGYTGTNFERPGFKRMMEDKPQTAPRRIRGCVCSLCGPFQFSLLLRKNVKFRDWQVWPLILSPCG